MIVSEMYSAEWDFRYFMKRRADRSGMLVEDYLRDKGVIWKFGEKNADLFVYKQFSGLWAKPRYWKQFPLEFEKKKNSVNIIAEPREIAPWAYFFANRERSLVSSPGNEFPNRLYFPSDWYEPRLEGWNRRINAFVFIGRPMKKRIQMIRELKDKGLPVAIYSRARWPFEEWQGPCDVEFHTSQKYRYRLVFENFYTAYCHSDKLFNGLRAGNITLYGCQPGLDIPGTSGTYLPFSFENAAQVYEDTNLQQRILKAVEGFLLSDRWEIYSFREFFNRILSLGDKILEGEVKGSGEQE